MSLSATGIALPSWPSTEPLQTLGDAVMYLSANRSRIYHETYWPFPVGPHPPGQRPARLNPQTPASKLRSPPIDSLLPGRGCAWIALSTSLSGRHWKSTSTTGTRGPPRQSLSSSATGSSEFTTARQPDRRFGDLGRVFRVPTGLRYRGLTQSGMTRTICHGFRLRFGVLLWQYIHQPA